MTTKIITLVSCLMAAQLSFTCDAQEQPIASSMLAGPMKSRIQDTWGAGQFKASRDGGNRLHNGLDIVVTAGEKIFAPFEGKIVNENVPYGDDKSYRGINFEGTGKWDGYKVRIFYVEGLFSGQATEGQYIGNAQDLSKRYPNITNHIHIEVRLLGNLIDPFTIWGLSF